MSNTREVAVRNRQTLEDVALQYYGAVEGVELLLMDNRDMLAAGFDTQLHEGDLMRIQINTELLNVDVRREMLSRLLVPAMADYVQPIPEGPDYNADHNIDHDI